MKLKIDLEIDWIDDNSNVDSAIKDQLIEKVVEKINESAIEDIAEQAKKKMTDRANEVVSTAYETLLGKPIVITDEWGNKAKEYPSVVEMIKSRFDKFMTEQVDSSGHTSSYGDTKRIDYIVKKQLEKITKDFTEKAVKEVAEKIRVTLNDSLKEKLGDRLINIMEIDKMIAKQLNP